MKMTIQTSYRRPSKNLRHSRQHRKCNKIHQRKIRTDDVIVPRRGAGNDIPPPIANKKYMPIKTRQHFAGLSLASAEVSQACKFIRKFLIDHHPDAGSDGLIFTTRTTVVCPWKQVYYVSNPDLLPQAMIGDDDAESRIWYAISDASKLIQLIKNFDGDTHGYTQCHAWCETVGKVHNTIIMSLHAYDKWKDRYTQNRANFIDNFKSTISEQEFAVQLLKKLHNSRSKLRNSSADLKTHITALINSGGYTLDTLDQDEGPHIKAHERRKSINWKKLVMESNPPIPTGVLSCKEHKHRHFITD
jgi:hypothetical protein